MGMTMTQKILASHAGLDSVKPCQLIRANLDFVLGSDITGAVAVDVFRAAGFDHLYDKDRVSLILDHFVPNKDIKAAKFKVKVTIEGDKLRVSSPSRDALQEVIAFLKEQDYGQPLQFTNYR